MLSLVAALLLSTLGLAPAASAAPASPDIDGGATVTNGSGDVVLAWFAVSAATTYKVDLSTDASFGSTLQSTITTAGLRATPSVALPAGTIWWRVAAVGTSGTSAYTTSSFDRTEAPGPSLVSPIDRTGLVPLEYPDDSPALSWNPIAAAKDYTVEWSMDDLFPAGGTTTQTTPATSFSIPLLLSRGTPWYWRVRANLTTTGLTTAWSQSGRFVIQWPSSSPELLEPANDPSAATKVSDVKLRWNPVNGAKSYKVYVATDPEFSAPVGDTPVTVMSTQYSPPRSWDSAAYYWKVTAVDPAGNEGPASVVRQFTRAWGPTTAATMSAGERVAAPATVAPASGTTVNIDDFRLEWTTVPRAAVYEVWLSGEGSNFFTDSSKILKCYTPHTSITSLSAWAALSAGDRIKDLSGSGNARTACFGSLGKSASVWAAGSTLRWRVRALDLAGSDSGSQQNPGNVDALSRFIRSAWSDRDTAADPASLTLADLHPGATTGLAPTLLAPADCVDLASCAALPDTPELVWGPAADVTAGYWLQIALDPDFTNKVAEFHTFGTRYRMDGSLLDNAANQAYYWRVMGCQAFSSFANKSCLSDTLANVRAFRKLGATVVNPVATTLQDQVTFSWDWNENLAAGSSLSRGGTRGYQVQVATDELFSVIVYDTTVDQPFATTSLDLLQDGGYYWRVRAIDGSAATLPWVSGGTFSKSATKPVQHATGPGATAPTLSWDSVPGTASYQVEIYNGDNLSIGGSKVLSPTGLVNAAFTPTTILAPGKYSWRLRRVDVGGNVLPWTVEPGFVGPTQTFTVTAPKALLQTPTNGATIAPSQRLLTWTGSAGSVRYRVQTSASASFSSTVESVDTVQTAYALAGSSYTPGGTYFWRVRPLNSGNSVLSASDDVYSFTVAANPPASPSSVRTTAGAGQLAVSWSAPANGGSAITGYVVRWVPAAGGASNEVAATTTSKTLTGLSPGVAYLVDVAAANAAGTSPFSSPQVQGTPTSTTTTTSTPSPSPTTNPTTKPPTGSIATALTIAGGRTIVAGNGTALTGTLKTSAGTAVGSKSVTVQSRPVGSTSWVTATTATTTSTGAWSATVMPTANREYRALFGASSPLQASTSGTAILLVQPKITRKLSANDVKLGTLVKFIGVVKPGHAGKTVYLQRYESGKWVSKKSTTVSSTSGYRLRWKASSHKDFAYRVYLPKHADHAAGYSAKITLTVK